jgi:hypothetical protein
MSLCIGTNSQLRNGAAHHAHLLLPPGAPAINFLYQNRLSKQFRDPGRTACYICLLCHFVFGFYCYGEGVTCSFLVNNVGSSTLHHNMKFPAFHHRKFQTQLFSLKPMTSSCHVRIVNETDKRASQPASLLRRLWQLQGKNSKGRRRYDAAAKCANLFRLICIQTKFLTPISSHVSHL